MRVLMVQTPSVESFTQERVYPIGIVTLATYLKQAGHEVEVLDMNLAVDQFGALKEKILDFLPQLVGLSLRNIDPLANKTSSLIPPFVVTARMVKALLPESWIVAGGTGFSLFPERIMAEVREIDYGIVGEGERSFPMLLENLVNPRPLPGLCLRLGDGLKINPPTGDFEMANYIVPCREVLSPELYKSINNYVPTLGIETKRGCPLNCAYCVYPKLQGRKLRSRPAEAVVDELESLHKEYGVRDFHFNDPVVNILPGHLETICREILRRKLQVTWTGFFRENLLDGENVRLYEASGCSCFSFSPDGLSQESLDVLGKNLTEADILRAGKLTSQTNVCTMYHFMVNVPGENAKTIAKGLELVDRLYEMHEVNRNLGTVVLNNIRILPGTPIEVLARKQGVIKADTDLLYPTYYNPSPYETLRYRLETYHLQRNVFMWQKVRSS
ncbi:MAG: B12 lower ligand biosynthesis radical SAM protein BzaD [Dehalobacterium sp.]